MNSLTQYFVMLLNLSRESFKSIKIFQLSRLFTPVDIASLVYFRIVFGAIMFWEVIRYFQYDGIKRYYLDPKFLFTYYGFEWIKPWPGDGMYYHFLALGVLSLFIILGLFYRVSALLFFLGFTYVFLLDQTRYLNHFYFVSIVSFLMIFIPAQRAFSIDARLRPTIRSDTAPAWALWVLRAQMGIVYFYGGLAKLNGDWLHALPFQLSLPAIANFPLISSFFTWEWMAYFVSYAGLLFDLLVVPLLLWQRTRIFAFCWAVAFHLTNAFLFNIGIFPWFSIAATALFFPPDWPRRFIGRLWGSVSKKRGAKKTHPHPVSPVTASLQRGQRVTIVLLGIYFAFQLLVPLRHHLYPGEVSWTEEGHYLSWRMMLRRKIAAARFFATDPVNNKSWEINVRDYLNRWQSEEMIKRPDMILIFSHHLAKELRKQGYEQIEIRAKVFVSLNARKPQYMVDPTVDLGSQPRSITPAKWIMPLVEPRPTREQIKDFLEKLINLMNSKHGQKEQTQ
ncbi:MAG TPA: HTTM domain-containing protein [Thermodesulfobacteriota bacterium]|nr:HTTM domain-containing protein [Thermodesulfobacteriota bacterium]